MRQAALTFVVSVLLALPARAATGEGAIVSADETASHVGGEMLRRGGNAVDAAVATALALAVTFPQAGNLGGGGFAVVRFDGEVAALDFREVAPSAASRDMFLDGRGEPIPDASLVGPLAAGVPGSAAGLFELHRRYGRLRWREVVAPSVELARDGFVVGERLAHDLADSRDRLGRFEETRAVFFEGDATLQEGSRLVQADLARTLRKLGSRGPRGITRGRIARAVEAASTRHGGVLTASDLARYEAAWREPVRFELAGWQAASMPLPSSGGMILAMTVGLLERLRWSTRDEAGRAHVLVEAWRSAFAARTRLGDPSTTEATPAELLRPELLDAEAARIVEAGGRARRSSESTTSAPPRAAHESPQTTHLSVVDGDGNAVAITTTLNETFGCGLVVAGAGFLLNDEMDDFTVAAGRPNTYGLVQGEANAIAPGKRMLSSMSPTIAWRGDDVIVVGSPGGPRIPTATLQVLLAAIVDEAPLQAAVDRPRVHHQWLPDEIAAEPGALKADVRAELERRGHATVAKTALGEVEAIRWSPDRPVEAAADQRHARVRPVVVTP